MMIVIYQFLDPKLMNFPRRLQTMTVKSPRIQIVMMRCGSISSWLMGPGAAAPRSAPGLMMMKQHACIAIYQACEFCRRPETQKNDKTVVISKQNEKPGAISIAGGSFWEDPAERFLLTDGGNGNVAASTPGPGPGSGTATARARGLLSKKILASVLISQPSRTSLRTRRGRSSAARKEETWLIQLIKQVTNS